MHIIKYLAINYLKYWKKHLFVTFVNNFLKVLFPVLWQIYYTTPCDSLKYVLRENNFLIFSDLESHRNSKWLEEKKVFPCNKRSWKQQYLSLWLFFAFTIILSQQIKNTCGPLCFLFISLKMCLFSDKKITLSKCWREKRACFFWGRKLRWNGVRAYLQQGKHSFRFVSFV